MEVDDKRETREDGETAWCRYGTEGVPTYSCSLLAQHDPSNTLTDGPLSSRQLPYLLPQP